MVTLLIQLYAKHAGNKKCIAQFSKQKKKINPAVNAEI